MKSPSNVFDINSARKSKGLKAINDDAFVPSAPSLADATQTNDQTEHSQNGVVLFLRHFLVMILMWLRGPLRLFLGVISVPAMVALPIVAFGLHDFPNKSAVVWSLVALSFGSFCIKWLYDTLVMKLSPDQLFLS
ncbi:hypothetical protein P2W50_31305 [Pseudomonas protegens]|uniref:hypothetical protein n=1 Tax=Pseudomonas protegens TaxID=380021 RepID=UPI0023EB9BCD|nr:hypothetical protein [Pseudomonas protegens]MDF4211141.1 hypothetical protein [Pseudomonas protegens]